MVVDAWTFTVDDRLLVSVLHWDDLAARAENLMKIESFKN